MADALSRVKYALNVLGSSTAIPSWITEVVNSYKGDTKCSDLIAKLAIDPTTHPPYTLTSGVLRYKGKIMIGNKSELKTSLLTSFHKSELGGHSGERATYHRLKILFTWPGMRKVVQTFVQRCPVCQLNKAQHVHPPGLLQPLQVPDFAWTHISMDFVEGLPKSEHKDMIVVVDRFTKYAHFVAMRHPITVKIVAQAFTDNIFRLHGLPTVIVTYRDRIFTSHL